MLDLSLILEGIGPSWHRNAPIDVERLNELQGHLGLTLPPDYVKFLLWSDGGEGSVGSAYLSLWPLPKVEQLNQDYGLAEFLPGVLAVGSDGGGECIAFDFRAPGAPPLIQVPFGDLNAESVLFLGTSFTHALSHFLNAPR